MGLDTVELVMEVEDAFSIKIPDDEASYMLTVGDLFDYIVANTNVVKDRSVCLSAIAFYSLRRAANSLGAENRLRPKDSTSEILPISKRREYWTQLQNRSELKLPPLRRPEWLVATGTVGTIACAILLGCLSYLSTDSQLVGSAIGFASAILIGLIVGVLTKPFAIYPSPSCKTIRGLTESALGLNFKTLSERYNGASPNDLWIALRAIIVEQLGVAPEEVKPAASFVKYLGCD